MSTYTTCSSTLASCALIFRRISATLAQDCVLILHRSQWQCLAKSYSEVLQSLAHLLQHACPPLGQLKLLAPLRALLHSMQEAERCIEDCTARRPTLSHSWLLDNALKLGPSSDVVNLHLRDFLWSFSAVLNQAMAPQIDTVKSDLVQLTRALSEIWAFEDSEADLSEACNFLNTIKAEEEGEPSLLADFILQKLSHAQDLESGEAGVLPDYLWIDPSSLTRNPELLGVGTYGKVQEAGWLGGRFAVKDFFYVEENTTFGREAAIQARLRHPNVISLICCTQNPSLYKCSLVMELMQQDLRVLMIEKTKTGMAPPFSLDVAVDLMLQIAQGLEYLHSLHIMHRDLKSSNILVSFSRRTCDGDMDDVGPRAYLKIADFGMSKAKHGSSKFTTKQVGATPWRAPEVFEINPEDEVEGDTNGKYTNKADVYSFGLVCYEILTGEFPFDGTQIRKRVLAGERPSLPSYCPPALSSYIQRCWHAEPWKRPPFRQICRMLRYFKACILHLDHHDQSPAQYSWLLHPLSSDVCARIDNMVISFMQPIDTPLQPQPVNIPLEMHCSRVVLEGREETERASNEHANGVRGRRITQGGVESNESTDELQQNGHGHRKYSSKAKGYSIYVSRLLKNLLCIQAAQPTKEELQAALGLVRDFTIEELRLATADFQKVIGEGATGTVYYGKLEDGREIAVKVAVHPKLLRSGHIVSTSETTGLMQELRIASQLRHRNIVPLFGWCQDRGKLLLLYEFMPNGNLARHIFGKQNSLDWQLRYNVVSQLASALKYLHQDSGYLQIVHRDVKASNLLLDSLWNARLGDCGLAVLLRNGDAPLQSLAGTFGYIAPESVAQGRVSPASDVYAFGVTVLEIATGRRAHFKDEMGEIHYVRDWIWRMYQLGDLMEVADIRLGGKFDEVKMKRLLLLGLSCTSVDPSMRPPIEEVLNILSGASEPAPRAQTTQIYLSSGMDSSTFASTSTGSFWNRPTVEHMSFDNNEASGPLTPIREAELDQISNVRVFTFNELKLATRNFRPENLLGEGGFGSVHKGSIDEVGPTGAKITSGTTVAVKVLNPKGLQGHKEWLSEVMLLGQLHHPHLVKLIGCCCEDEHRLLVYKFMPRGSLDNHLYGKTTLSLSWTTRMKIALGAAEGLAFLHGLVKPILLRDFKTSNILLDSDYTAKLSDFGFAKHGPMDDETHVSTLVLGTYGYVAPEYVATGRLTWRSDIYSYGIVLLELLTGQKSVDKTRGMGKENLVEWVCPYLRDKRRWSQVMDPKLRGLYSLKKAQRAAHLALDCLSSDPKKRPLISNVVQTLESLQEREKDHMQQVHQGHTKQ